MKYLLILLTCFTVTSCQQRPSGSSASDQSVQVAPIDTTTRDFTGLYRQSEDQTTFQDCNANEVYWLEDSTNQVRNAYAEATKTLGYPGESLHLEIAGHLAKPDASGPGADYQKKLVVTRVGILKPKSFKTPCYNFEFIALGNEPFWSVEIIPNEQRIVLKDVGLNKVYVFPYQPANAGGGVHRYETKSGSDKLTVVIREEKCSDGMSDREYDYSAEIILNDRTLKGCAIRNLKNL